MHYVWYSILSMKQCNTLNLQYIENLARCAWISNNMILLQITRMKYKIPDSVSFLKLVMKDAQISSDVRCGSRVCIVYCAALHFMWKMWSSSHASPACMITVKYITSGQDSRCSHIWTHFLSDNNNRLQLVRNGFF